MTEQGIPDDIVHRISRARSDDERAAVDSVLADFFTLVDGVWTNGRVEEELVKARIRIDAARLNGKKGGRKPKDNPAGTQQEPNGLIPLNPNGTQSEPSAKLTIYPPNHLPNKDQKISLKKDSKPKAQTLTAWIADLDGDAILAADPIFDWSGKVGIPREWIALAWWSFEGRYTGDGQGHAKKYTDWRATFRNAVKDDWLKLWYVGKDGYVLTTAGQQAQREMAA